MVNILAKKRKITKKIKKKYEKITRIDKAKNYVCNYSDKPLTNAEILALNKGLSFIPTPAPPTERDLINDWKRLARSMRLKLMFANKPTRHRHPFKNDSTFTPCTSDSVGLENYLYSTRIELEKLAISVANGPRAKSNVTSRQRAALKSLSSRNDIVINKADKGSMTIIRSRQEYVTEGERQLLKSGNYEPISHDMTDELSLDIHKVLLEMLDLGEIDNCTFNYLDPLQGNTHTAELYHLAKVHKALTELGTFNSRPIISGCGTPNERISEFLEFFQRPLALLQSTNVRDTTDLLCRLESLIIPKNAILLVGDILSMYTNIPHNTANDLLKISFEENENFDYGFKRPSTQSLLKLAKLVFECNYFKFNGKHYRQTCGLAMGSRASVSGSDIVVHHIEKQLLQKYTKQLLLFLRFRDDVFAIFCGSQKECNMFVHDANSLHKSIQFNFEISNSKVNFLDVEIFKGERFQRSGILDCKTFFKPTNKFQYLHRESAHPPGVFKALIKGELLRYARNTNSESDFKTQVHQFKGRLVNRGYCSAAFDKISAEINHNHRSEYLNKNVKDKGNPPLVFVTTYSPYVQDKLPELLRKHWPQIKNSSKLNGLFTEPPIVSYKRNTNIGDDLVRAKLKPESKLC